MKPFDKFRKNFYSQNGEDGIILELLRRMKLDDFGSLWCVEYGAYDGKHLSNTFNLVEKGSNAVYIEGLKERFEEIKNLKKKYPKINCIRSFVSREKDDKSSINNLLNQTQIPKDFDILSIDIDSYDLDTWECLTDYYPKIVIIEINSSIPPGIYQKHSDDYSSNSFSSTVKVAKQKGYIPICHTGNLVLVKDEFRDILGLDEEYINSPEKLFDESWLPKNNTLIIRAWRKLKRLLGLQGQVNKYFNIKDSHG